ncbi:hypothetical protein PanWU01x14_149200, partial [Parasponia andersonii]
EVDVLLRILTTTVVNVAILEEIALSFYRLLHRPLEDHRRVKQLRHTSLVSKLGLLISKAQLRLSTLLFNTNIVLRVLPSPQGIRPPRHLEYKRLWKVLQ